MNTLETVRRIIAKRMDCSEDEITPETSLYNDLNADSLDVVEITMDIEESFAIQCGDDAMALSTVQQIVEYVESKKGMLV